jgi:hypothetical protein
VDEAALPTLSVGDVSARVRTVEELEIRVVADHHRTTRTTGQVADIVGG